MMDCVRVVLKGIGMQNGSIPTEGTYEKFYAVLSEQLGSEMVATGGHGAGATVANYNSFGSVLQGDGTLYRVLRNMKVTVIPPRGKAERRGWESGGWGMELRAMTKSEATVFRLDNFEMIYRKLAGKNAKECDVLEVTVPEDFDEFELALFLDGVFRSI